VQQSHPAVKRIFFIVLDGCGIGEMPDSKLYNDKGSNTLGNLAKAVSGMQLPALERLGLGKIAPIDGLKPDVRAVGSYGKMAEASPGKDSTTGHWELAGIILDNPFPVYPEGFPEELIGEFKNRTGLEVLGNKAASGTEIIKELGPEHLRTGKPIVYTSADSVFQIAAHDDVIPLKELYALCHKARSMLTGEHAVARVIARPFIGHSPEDFTRTKYRKDFSLKPESKTFLEILQENDIPTYGIGKIYDLYGGIGLGKSVSTKQNSEGMKALMEAVVDFPEGLIMANLVDFDMLWGHRNNTEGFYVGLKEFDCWLTEFLEELTHSDILIVTADHGNDPTTPSTDHSREYVPVLVYGRNIKADKNIGTRKTFADIQATMADACNVSSTGAGSSFWADICF
jgi:phosphopentomutase